MGGCCCCLVTKLCPTLSSSMNWSPLGPSVLGISQAGILEWAAIPFCREICVTQGWNWRLLHWRADSLPAEPSGEPWVEEGAARELVVQQFRKAPEARCPSWGAGSGPVAEPRQEDAFVCKVGFCWPSLPTPVSDRVSQEPAGIKWKARKVRGGSSCQITRLAGPGAHCSRPASPPARLLQKDAPGSAWTSATSKPSVTLSHLVPTSLFCEVSITERPRRQKRKRQGPKELGVHLQW